jgi:DNA-binding CsgD family transcriptional regulator
MSLNDQLAKLWAAGQTLSEIERSTGISRGVAIGHIYRARKAGDPHFQPRVC